MHLVGFIKNKVLERVMNVRYAAQRGVPQGCHDGTPQYKSLASWILPIIRYF
jgi:hypothetical protein